MKYYSEVLREMFDSVEACEKAEKLHAKEQEEKELLAKKKREEKEARFAELDGVLKEAVEKAAEANELYKKYYELRNAYWKDYPKDTSVNNGYENFFDWFFNR